MLEWKIRHDANNGLFPIRKSASLVYYARSTAEEKLQVRELQSCSAVPAACHCRSLGWHRVYNGQK